MTASRALRLLRMQAEGEPPAGPVTWGELTQALLAAEQDAEDLEHDDRMGEDQ